MEHGIIVHYPAVSAHVLASHSTGSDVNWVVNTRRGLRFLSQGMWFSDNHQVEYRRLI